MKIKAVITFLIGIIFILTGCSLLGSSGIISDGREEAVNEETKSPQGREAVEKAKQEEPQDKDNMPEAEKSPVENSNNTIPEEEEKENSWEQDNTMPKGSFMLGEYYSPDEKYKFQVWAWYDYSEEKLMAEFLFGLAEEEEMISIIRTSLVENRRKNRKNTVIWLDSERALLNGHILFNCEEGKKKDLRPEEMTEVWDYHVNNSRSALALMGKGDDGVRVMLIDLDTLYELPVFTYTLENPWLEQNLLRIMWGPDNNLYFDAELNGKPVIYCYKTLEDKVELFLYNATLLNIDYDSGVLHYAELVKNGMLPPKEKSINLYSSEAVKGDPGKILAAAEKFMKETGREVGNEIGKYVLSIERIMDEKALVAFGTWASEYNGILILEEREGSWQVVYEKYLYYFNPKRYKEAVDLLEEEGNYDFGEEPGKDVAGVPFEYEDTAAFLIGPYEGLWEKQYIVKKSDENWEIVKQVELEGTPIFGNGKNSPFDVVEEFLLLLKGKQYDQAQELVIEVEPEEANKYFAGTLPNLLNEDNSLKEFDVGEIRLLEKGDKALVQVWLVFEEDYLYGWLICLREEGGWKVALP